MGISKPSWIGALVWGLAVALCLVLPGPARAVAVPDTIGLFRPNAPPGNNTFFLLNKNILAPPANTIAGYGNTGDVEVVGDRDGDGIVTIGVFRPDSPVVGTNTYFLRNTNSLGTGDVTIESIGQTGDIPIVGDWDGNGTTTVGLFRPNVPPGMNTLLLWNSNNNPPGPPDIIIAGIGANGDRPVVGTWTGTGNAFSIGLLRPNVPTDLNTFFIWNSLPLTPPYVPDFTIFGIGANGDRPLAGDWDGNGTVTIGLFRSGEPAGLNSFFLWNSIPTAPPWVPDIIVAGFGAAGLDHPVTGHWGNNPPVVDPATFSVPENSPNDTNVGTVTFSEPDNPDQGQTLTLSIVGGNTNNAFKIDAGTRQIKVNNSAALDFETQQQFNLVVQVTDNGTPPFSGQAIVTVNVTDANDPPVMTAPGGPLAYTENDTPKVVNAGVTVTDVDSATLASATVRITGNCTSLQDVLGFADAFGVTNGGYVSGTCTLTLNGPASPANFQSALRTVTYQNTSDSPATAQRTVTWTANDGAATSSPVTSAINVTAVNDAPVMTAPGGPLAYTENDPPKVVNANVTVTDADSATLASATVRITGNCANPEDVLGFTPAFGVTNGGYTAATCSLLLNGPTTPANFELALRTVTYQNGSDNPSTAARTVTWTANDGALTSTPVTSGITVTAVNDAPALASAGSTISYTENDAAKVIESGITVTDVDSTIASATVKITTNCFSGEDVLSFVNQSGVTFVSYTAATCTLALAGPTTPANFTTALRNVKYDNTSENPIPSSPRTVTWQVNDGAALNNLSNTVTSTINVTAVNDPPTANGFTNLPAQAGIQITYPAGKLGGADIAAEGTAVTINTTPDSLCAGCLLTINANGSFTFTPPLAAAGTTVSFTYHVTDSGTPAPGVNSAPATVSFDVAGPEIYFVKSAAVGVGNCTLGNECTLATALDGTHIGARTNTRIYINDGSGCCGNVGVTLNSDGWLIGQGVTGTTFDTLFGIAAPAEGTLANRPTLGGARPTLTGANATVTVHNNSAVRGLDINVSAGSNKGLVGSAKSGVAVTDLDVTSAGGNAIDLTNTSANFTGGGLNITSTGGSGFNAAGGGTVNVSGSNNTVTSTTGTAVNLNGVGGAITLRSVSSNTAQAAGVANGIVIQSTLAGFSFIVDGDGSNTAVGGNSSGGTISRMEGADGAVAGNGVYLSGTQDVTLRRMTINGTNHNHGIRGINVTGFNLEYSTVTGTNGNSAGLDEGSVNFDNLLGSAAITSCLIEGGFEDNLNVVNTSGTLDRLVITATTFGFNSTANGNNNILIESQNPGTVLKYTIQSSLIRGARSDWLNAQPAAGGTLDAIIGGSTPALGNTFSNISPDNHPAPVANGNRILLQANGTSTFNIQNNIIKGSLGSALATNSLSATALMSGTIKKNTIGVAATANSGSTSASGISIQSTAGGDVTVLIDDNGVFQYNNHGILFTLGDQMGAPPTINATVTNNVTNTPGTLLDNFNGFHLNNGSVATDSFTTCLDIHDNNFTGGGKGATSPNNSDVRLRQRQATTVQLPGYTGPARDNGDLDVAEVITYLRPAGSGGLKNNTFGTGNANSVSTGGGYVNSPGGGACTLPP